VAATVDLAVDLVWVVEVIFPKAHLLLMLEPESQEVQILELEAAVE
jgi:hypothetical protein